MEEMDKQYTYFPSFLKDATKKLRIIKAGKELEWNITKSFKKDFAWTR